MAARTPRTTAAAGASVISVRGARAQPAQHQRRAAPRQADRLHRAVRLGQVEPGVRHDLRRGPAPLRRVAVVVRPAVPRADGQARRRRHRGPVAGDLDRPEVGQPQPPLDRRHDHRGLRLPAPAVRPHRRPALPGPRQPARPPDAAADRRPRPAAAGGHPLPGARAGRARPQGRVRDAARGPLRAGLRAGPCRRRGRRHRRVPEAPGAPGPLRAAHDRGRRRPPRHARGHRPPAHRLAGDRAQAGRRRRRAGDRPPRGRGADRRRPADVQRAPRVPGRRPQLRGAGAAQLLVQLAVRRLPDVRRPRHDVRDRPRARHPRPRPLAQRRRHRPVAQRPHPVLHADARLGRRRRRHRHGRPVGLADGQAAEGHPRGHQGQRHRQVQEPLRPPAPVHDDVRGRDPVDQAAPRGRRERLGPRAVRGLHAPRAVQGLRRRPPQAGDARRDDQRAQHLRGLRPVDRRGRQVPRRPRADRARADDRRARDEGGQRPARVPARRRPRLPHAVALGRHAGGRRGPAHPPGQPDRLRPRRHAVRARRAVDRPAPARQPAPHRHPDAAARPRQHRHRRRARRGDDPRERLDRRHRARAPASTAAVSSTAAR